MAEVRIDKWLWAARFFKTRSLASKACDMGRVESNGQRAKASREVRPGDLLLIRNDGGEFQIEVLQVSEMRGPAAVAQALYRETEASKVARLKVAGERRAGLHSEIGGEGRPSKRDRRLLVRLHGRAGT